MQGQMIKQSVLAMFHDAWFKVFKRTVHNLSLTYAISRPPIFVKIMRYF